MIPPVPSTSENCVINSVSKWLQRRRSKTPNLAQQVSQRLALGLDPYRHKLAQRHIRQLVAQYLRHYSRIDAGDLDSQLIGFLSREIKSILEQILELRRNYSQFNQHYAQASGHLEANTILSHFLTQLGYSAAHIRGDLRAFKRWFDKDAVDDRYAYAQAMRESGLAFALECYGKLLHIRLSKSRRPEQLWQDFDPERSIQELLAFDGDPRVQQAAFQALSQAIHALPEAARESSVSDATLHYVYNNSLNHRSNVWLQIQALDVLEGLSQAALLYVLDKRLQHPRPGDDFFVRSKAVEIIAQQLPRHPSLNHLLVHALNDPSPYVRQHLCLALPQADDDSARICLEQLLLHDAEPSVRARCLLSLSQLLHRRSLFPHCRQLLLDLLQQHEQEFVFRVAFKVISDINALLFQSELHEQQQQWLSSFEPVLARFSSQAQKITLRRWAALHLQQLRYYQVPAAVALGQQLAPLVQAIPAGQRRRLPTAISAAADPDTLALALAHLASQDHSLELEGRAPHWYLRRGHRFGFRLWRVIHELRHPATDKRQAHRHSVGRIFYGLLNFPSQVMAEQAQTKVPGEPLVLTEEDGWRQYLPLVDQVISCLDQSWPARPLVIHSPQGITRVTPPESLFKRLYARSRLVFEFARYAQLRNWRRGDKESPSAYIEALRELGFTIEFEHHRCADGQALAADSSVQRFFAFSPLPLALSDRLVEMRDYFFSVYENSLFHLTVFITSFSLFFFGRHIWINQQFKRARRAIPLVIGGWGTRGKSGTERLKAALVNALGYATVSKTTGCEAMFLASYPFGSLREMYLFRPYDKATIWEQFNLVRLAQRLNAEVFLWECMGLTPSYIKILQQDWMQDDLATITNTYPDHEDLQGPAGIDIPQVMTNFIPPRATLVTTEEKMLPILADAAQLQQTKLHAVGWLEAGLITPDILARYPYDEHPYNIALVTKMAESLGIGATFALKEMADRVVLDLGVLRTYPLSSVRSRRLEFVMGMSANERFGALGNWRRMGFEAHHLERDPEIWTSTVVNNRADRVARSKVFASLLINDVSADCHVLIGNNLTGLRGYIKEAWDERAPKVSLWGDAELTPQQALQNLGESWRVAVNTQQLLGRLQAMLRGIGVAEPELPTELPAAASLDQLLSHPPWREEFLSHWQAMERSHKEYLALQQALEQALSQAQVDQQTFNERLRDQLWQWFERKISVVEDYYASGNDVINHIVASTPPGLKNRIMGMQNIKGTGLDYVYRWQAWDTCYHACQQLTDPQQSNPELALKNLSKFKEFGPLSEEQVLSAVSQAQQADWAQRSDYQAELRQIEAAQRASTQVDESNQNNQTPAWRLALIGILENYLDAGDAVKRRKRADQIYADLAHMRISRDRAALELQNLTKRQKGGWLYKQLTRQSGQ